jgi:transposase
MTPEAKIAATKPESKKPTAKKKGPSKDINKSAEIRKVADQMKAKGEKPRPVVIIEILKKQGIEVSSPQVSMVLKKMGFRPRKRRAKGAAAAKAAPRTGGRNTTKITVEDLVKAQKVVAQFGGTERALAALQALQGFEEE